MIKITKTDRGYRIGEFEDVYGQKCSIQESSLACAPHIWLGVTNTGPRFKDLSGKFNQNVLARMHLTLEDVGNLIPLLIYFLEHGELPE